VGGGVKDSVGKDSVVNLILIKGGYKTKERVWKILGVLKKKTIRRTKEKDPQLKGNGCFGILRFWGTNPQMKGVQTQGRTELEKKKRARPWGGGKKKGVGTEWV